MKMLDAVPAKFNTDTSVSNIFCVVCPLAAIVELFNINKLLGAPKVSVLDCKPKPKLDALVGKIDASKLVVKIFPLL